MKKQFVIKTAQSLKNVGKSVTKSESTNFLKLEFIAGGPVCCDFIPDFIGLAPKRSFSL